MRKDSTWSRLTSAQRAKLEKWLFEGNLGYAEAVARAHKEFGVKGTVASMGRYYRRRAQERQPAELLEAQIAAAEVNDSPVKVENLRRAGMKLIGHLALKQALEKPGELEPLVRLTKLLLASEGNGVRQGKLKLAERYFYREATEAARKGLAQLGAYLAGILEDASLDAQAKIEKVKQMLYTGEGSKPGAEAKDDPGNGPGTPKTQAL
jgi:hypothetical protein